MSNTWHEDEGLDAIEYLESDYSDGGRLSTMEGGDLPGGGRREPSEAATTIFAIAGTIFCCFVFAFLVFIVLAIPILIISYVHGRIDPGIITPFYVQLDIAKTDCYALSDDTPDWCVSIQTLDEYEAPSGDPPASCGHYHYSSGGLIPPEQMMRRIMDKNCWEVPLEPVLRHLSTAAIRGRPSMSELGCYYEATMDEMITWHAAATGTISVLDDYRELIRSEGYLDGLEYCPWTRVANEARMIEEFGVPNPQK